MAERAYSAAFADQVARAIAEVEDVSLHAGFERIEISHKDSTTLGFVEPSGLWLDTDVLGAEEHPGRFGRTFLRVADADATDGFASAVAAAISESERGETWAAMPVMQVSTGLYLGLMNGDAEALSEVAGAVPKASQRASLWRLWEPRNWRPHMLACAAACVSGDPAAVDTAWMAFDRYSWAGPQIAATLARIDSDFAAAAAARLELADPTDQWPRPLDRYILDGKSRGALKAMLDRPASDGEQDGSRLAAGWKTAIERYLQR